MNIKHYKPLHYLLIILLMLTPLRAVMAVQSSHCDMAEMDMDVTALSISMAMPVQHHEMHDMSSGEMSAIQVSDDQSAGNQQCCCCDSDCASNCDMSVTASLHMQASSYSPVYINTSNTTSFNSEVLVRALTPPSRPPAKLS